MTFRPYCEDLLGEMTLIMCGYCREVLHVDLATRPTAEVRCWNCDHWLIVARCAQQVWVYPALDREPPEGGMLERPPKEEGESHGGL